MIEKGDISEKSDADNLKVLEVIDPSLITFTFSGIGGGSFWRES